MSILTTFVVLNGLVHIAIVSACMSVGDYVFGYPVLSWTNRPALLALMGIVVVYAALAIPTWVAAELTQLIYGF